MTNDTKNLIDVILTVVTMFGAGVAFVVGLRQWQRGQTWQRSEHLDKLVMQFESDELLRLGMTILDWTDRTTTFRARQLKVQNDQVLLALRDHEDIEDEIKFPGEQATLRDAYDALLAFFNRIELALSMELIDVEPAKAYFAYWLTRLVLFDRHPSDNKIMNGVDPRELVTGYIRKYGDPESVEKLCKLFSVPAPEFDAGKSF